MSTAPRVTPQQAWETFIAGNERFITGVSSHPNQDVERRSELVNSQSPDVALFGCSDSRLAAWRWVLRSASKICWLSPRAASAMHGWPIGGN